MLSLFLVWPKLCLCGEQAWGFAPKIIWCGTEPHCSEGLMLKGGVMQWLVWELYEAIFWPLHPFTWLATCQGRENQGEMWTAWPVTWKVRRSKLHDQLYARGGRVTLSTLVSFSTWLIVSTLLKSADCLLYQVVLISASHSCWIN